MRIRSCRAWVGLIGTVLALAGITVPSGSTGAATPIRTTPYIISLSYNPAPRTGGVVNVRARVANADQCRLRALSARVDHSVFSTAWQSCVNGAFDTHITFGANLGVTNREQRFEILGKEDHATYALRTFMAVSDGAGSSQRRYIEVASLERTTQWAGYVPELSTLPTSISATWKVPKIACSAKLSNAWMEEWVGLQNASSTQLLQDGVVQTCLSKGSNGKPLAQPFFEQYPSSPASSSEVYPGDTVTASLWNVGGNKWMWSVRDHTTGRTYAPSSPVNYTGGIASAEFIIEDPGNPVVPFVSNFSPVTFTNMLIDTIPPVASGGIKFQMSRGGAILATPGAIRYGPSGASMRVIYGP